jgi:hypothetical protein
MKEFAGTDRGIGTSPVAPLGVLTTSNESPLAVPLVMVLVSFTLPSFNWLIRVSESATDPKMPPWEDIIRTETSWNSGVYEAQQSSNMMQ